jgi:hypothetical protein
MSYGELIDFPTNEPLDYPEPGPFVPSFSVTQQVIVDDRILGAYDDIKRCLRSERKPINGHVIPPENLCLVNFEQEALIGQLEQPGIVPETKRAKRFLTEDIESAAHSLHLGLSFLMQDSPTTGMNLPLTGPRLYQGGKVIGVGPYGWEGFRAKYGTPVHRADKMNPNQIMATINQMCLGSLAVHLSQDGRPALNMSALLTEPHIPLMHLNIPIPKGRFRRIQEILDSAVPEGLTLADPVIRLQLEPDTKPEILPVWPRQEDGGKLRLVSKAA